MKNYFTNLIKQFKRLKEHEDFKIKDKTNYRDKQKDFANLSGLIFWLAMIILLVIDIILHLIIKNKNTIGLEILFIIVIFCIVFSLLYYGAIFFPRLIFIGGIPLFSVLFFYDISPYLFLNLNQVEELVIYLFFCFLFYIFWIFLLPINIFRDLIVNISFIPTLISVFVQIINSALDWIFNLATNNSEEKIIKHLMNVKDISRSNFTDLFSNLYNYTIINVQKNLFSSKLSIVLAAITLTFLISNVLIILRTNHLNKKANKKLHTLIFCNEKPVNYNNLIDCAYFGGTNYENYILANSTFRKIILEKENIINAEVMHSKKEKNNL